MEKIIDHISPANYPTHAVYPRFLQIVLNSKLTEEQRELFSNSNMISPPVMPIKNAVQLRNQNPYPNNNGGLPNVTLTDHIRDCFRLIELQVEAQIQEIQEQEHMDVDPLGALAAEEQKEQEDVEEGSNQQSQAHESYHPQPVSEEKSGQAQQSSNIYRPGTGNDSHFSEASFDVLVSIGALQSDPSHSYQKLTDYPQRSIESENLQIHNLTPFSYIEQTQSSNLPLKRK